MQWEVTVSESCKIDEPGIFPKTMTTTARMVVEADDMYKALKVATSGIEGLLSKPGRTYTVRML